jgi:hypothetical protein
LYRSGILYQTSDKHGFIGGNLDGYIDFAARDFPSFFCKNLLELGGRLATNIKSAYHWDRDRAIGAYAILARQLWMILNPDSQTIRIRDLDCRRHPVWSQRGRHSLVANPFRTRGLGRLCPSCGNRALGKRA